MLLNKGILNKKVKMNNGIKLVKLIGLVAITFSTATTLQAATLSPNCAINVTSATSLEVIGSDGAAISISPAVIGVNATVGDSLSATVLQCISLSAPADATVPCALSPNGVILPGDGSPIYLSRYDVPEDTYCSYEITLTPTAVSAIPFMNSALPPAPMNPTAVPIFTPIGLIAIVSGMLWFGRRRSLKIKD